LAAAYLSDQGADVVKVEPPGGDPTRRYVGSRVWNRGKRSIVADVTTGAGQEVVRRLTRSADVLIETTAPGTMARLGLDDATLRAENPRLVYCSITGYGRRSAARDRPPRDALVQARMGMHFEQPSYRKNEDGSYVHEPVFLYVPLPSYGAMFLAGMGVLAALHAREVTGAGQWVETSLAQGALMWTSQIRYSVEHEPPNFATVPYESRGTLFECADSLWVHLMMVRDSNDRLHDVLGLPPEARIGTLIGTSPEQRAVWRGHVEQGFKRHTRREVLAMCHAADVPVVPVQSAAEAYTTPQLVHNGMVVTVEDPDVGTIQMMGIPYYLEKNSAKVQGPQPRVGADTVAVLKEIGYSDEEIADLGSPSESDG
jgi:crotonobetainyl-CoA:carnitine CoA-transferase CaiB-like acyl-CoA transferase